MYNRLLLSSILLTKCPRFEMIRSVEMKNLEKNSRFVRMLCTRVPPISRRLFSSALFGIKGKANFTNSLFNHRCIQHGGPFGASFKSKFTFRLMSAALCLSGCTTSVILFFSQSIACDSPQPPNEIVKLNEPDKSGKGESIAVADKDHADVEPVYEWFWKQWLLPDLWLIFLSCLFSIAAIAFRPSLRTIFFSIPGANASSMPSFRLGLFALYVSISSVMTFSSNFLLSFSMDRYLQRVRLGLFKKLVSLDMENYADHKISHRMISLINTEALESRSLVKQFVGTLTMCLTQSVFSIYEMYSITPAITSITVLFLFPLVYGVGVMGQGYLKLLRKNMKGSEADLETHVKVTLDQVKMIKAMNTESDELDNLNSNSRDLLLKSTRFNVALSSFLGVSSLVVSSLSVLMASSLLLIDPLSRSMEGESVIKFASFLENIQSLQRSFGMVGILLSQWVKLKESARELVQFMQIKAKVENPFGTESSATSKIPPQIESISFNNVSFKYPRQDEIALKNININLKRGQMVALVGQSGSGKSTIASLLERFYDPIEGEIVINDKEQLKSIDISSWRRSIGYISQEPNLLPLSVYENLIYGHRHETFDRESVLDACKIAQIHDFILSLPKGYDTPLGQISLSGGQKQRLSIARTLVRRMDTFNEGIPPIMILDEATSALDGITERNLQNSLYQHLKQRCIMLVIAHRLETIKEADLIIVLDNGKVVEVGTHAELLLRGHKYRDLYLHKEKI